MAPGDVLRQVGVLPIVAYSHLNNPVPPQRDREVLPRISIWKDRDCRFARDAGVGSCHVFVVDVSMMEWKCLYGCWQQLLGNFDQLPSRRLFGHFMA